MNVKVKFKENNVSIPIKFSQIQSVSDPDINQLPQYQGEYNVNLSAKQKTLPTSNKWLKNDIVINKIPIVETLNAIENGVYNAPNNIDGYSSITVNVKPKLQEKSVTENCEVVADSGYEGLSKVNVNVKPTIEPLEITANGTYNLREGVDGYAPITVNVQPEGGNPIDALIDGSITEVDSNVTSVINYTFHLRKQLTKANLPNAIQLGTRVFDQCSALTEVNLPKAEKIGQYAFYNCTALKSIDLPNVTSSDISLFEGCATLETANLPKIPQTYDRFFYNCKALKSADITSATRLEDYTFYSCDALQKIVLPSVKYLNTYVFQYCRGLESVDFYKRISIDAYAFQNCYMLKTLILRGETLSSLSNTNAFNGCYHILGKQSNSYNPTGAQDGYIYVPRALVDSYKSATNWTTYATQFRALEDYTVDGTITGELDPTKI
jgi:hypothetical protein